MRTGVMTDANCAYTIDQPPYYDIAPVDVDYPYLTEADLKVTDYPVSGPYGSHDRDDTVGSPDAPDPQDAEPQIEELLNDPAHDELRRLVLVAVTAARILENNSDAVDAGDLTEDQARKIATSCIDEAGATPGMATADCGRRDLPVFVAGYSDYPEASDHVTRGLTYHPQWFELRYYQRPESQRGWQNSYPETDNPSGPNCIGEQPVTACDEFPFFKTEQGAKTNPAGADHVPLPHLKLIDWGQNSGSGGRFGNFVLNCQMAVRRDAGPEYGSGNFLVVPVPGVPTRGYCNGPNPSG